MAAFFEDEIFQDRLVALLIKDATVCRAVSPLLSPDDFKPLQGMKQGRSRWITATCALTYYRKYREPVRKLIRSEVLAYGKDLLGVRELKEVATYADNLIKTKIVGADSITEKVIALKRERRKALALQELSELHSRGELTDEKWRFVTRNALGDVENGYHVSDYLENLELRIQRRKHAYALPPLMMIDPLDQLVTGPNRKQLALVLAPFKRGKSLFLIHLARAYALQQLRVLFITLEDPLTEVENRLDASISAIPVAKLRHKPKTLRERFQRFKRLIHSRIRIVDGTEASLSIHQIDEIIDNERESGFFPDVLIIDYDDELAPSIKSKERRFEIDIVYRELRKCLARHNLIGWTAAQTKRGTENLKILSGDQIAEDIGKLRKVHMAIGMGKGEWGDESMYLWVAAHKADKQHVGCHIVPDKSRMLLYDVEQTRRAAAEYEEKDYEEEI